MSNDSNNLAVQDEKGLLDCIFDGGMGTALDVIKTLPRDAFEDLNSREVFSVIEKLTVQGVEPNEINVISCWSKHSDIPCPQEFIRGCLMYGPTKHNVSYHLLPMMDRWRRRELAGSTKKLLLKLADDTVPLDEVKAELLNDLSFTAQTTDDNWANGRMLSQIAVNDFEKSKELKGKHSGLDTGFTKLDNMLSGLQFGEQTILAARPSVGKTALAVNIIRQICLCQQVPTLLISLEMSFAAIIRRLAADLTQTPLAELKDGSYGDFAFQRITTFLCKLNKAPLYMVNGVNGMTAAQAARHIRSNVMQFGVKFVVVDYLQKLKADQEFEKRTYEVASVSNTLRAVAVDQKVALLTLAQLNREQEKGNKPRQPRISDLADSSQIERDADTIILMDRDRNNPDALTALAVAKQRDGETGVVFVHFNGPFCRFENPQHP